MHRDSWQMRRALAMTLSLALGLSVTGCGANNSLAREIIERARQDVQTALEAWKKGESLAKLGPPLQVTDQDWKAGLRLLDYELKRAEGFQGENVRCWVHLSLQDRKGKKLEKEVVYEVRPGDKPVIARDPFF